MRVFSEIQRFNQWWIQLINMGLLGLLLFCFYSWFIAKEPTGNVSANDTIGQLIVIFSIIPVLWLFYLMKMETAIDEIGVHYQFMPFQFSKKIIRWNEMENCYVRTYRPIKEFGGWGYRTAKGKKGKALNIRGNKGIQLELKSGGKLLIGTQKEEDAQQVIRRHFKKSDE